MVLIDNTHTCNTPMTHVKQQYLFTHLGKPVNLVPFNLFHPETTLSQQLSSAPRGRLETVTSHIIVVTVICHFHLTMGKNQNKDMPIANDWFICLGRCYES